MKNKRILVTGGAGFIGSHLVDALVKDNEVTVLDNLSSGSIANVNQKSLPIYDIDLAQVDCCSCAMAQEGYFNDARVIFHLATECLRKSLNKPSDVYRNNVSMTLNMCHLAHINEVELFVYVSSSEVYGTAEYVPMDENHPLKPTTLYGASKLAGENIALAYHRAYGLPVVIVRPFNTVGAREHAEGVYGEVIPRFVSRAMNGKSPIIYGDGYQTRDFTSVHDVVRGIIKASECKEMIGDVVNIARGQEVPIEIVATMVKAFLLKINQDGNYPIENEHQDARPADVKQHRADISKAMKLLNYTPKYDIADAIKDYIDWYKESGLNIEVEERNW